MVENSPADARDAGSISVGKISWRRKWQLTQIFLPGKAHGQRSLVGYSPWGRKESETTEAAEQMVPGLGCWVDTFLLFI